MTLTVEEFIRRFLLHVLPTGFLRIRHYGVLGNRCRTPKVAACRQLFAQPAPPVLPPESAATLMRRLTGLDIERCPQCRQGRLVVIATLLPFGLPGLRAGDRPPAIRRVGMGTVVCVVHRGGLRRHAPRASPGHWTTARRSVGG